MYLVRVHNGCVSLCVRERSHYVREVGRQTLTGSLRCEDSVAVEEMHGRRVGGGGGGGFWRVYKSGPRDLKKLF